MNKTNLLRSALWLNAIFSTLCAFCLLIKPIMIGQVLGWQYPLIYQGLGLGLLIFGIDLMHQASRQRLSALRALASSLADFGWVIGTIIITVLFGETLTLSGELLLISIALFVLFCGVLQTIGILKLYQNPQRHELLHYCISVDTDAPLPQLWLIIRDLGGIQRYANNLASSEIVSKTTDFIGTIRQCTDNKGKVWQEECTELEHERSLSLRFNSEADGFPFPAKEMLGQWKIEPITLSNGTKGTQVKVSWDLQPKPAWMGFLLMPILQHQIQKDFPILLGKMAEDAKLIAAGKPLPATAATSTFTLGTI